MIGPGSDKNTIKTPNPVKYPSFILEEAKCEERFATELPN